jgi:hypothetical protein
MSNISFSNVFSGDYLLKISKYSERVQTILDSYDVVLFMDRKAICFYKAMVINKAVTPNPACRVTSSRIVNYNALDKLRGKRVAVIDDVVVKGESISRVAGVLKNNSIDADYYVVACESNFAEQLDICLQPTFSHYEKSEIYTVAGLITQYIEASMCPFNIDQPIFDISTSSDILRKWLDQAGAIDISSGLQKKYGITNEVVYFNLPVTVEKENPPHGVFDNSILKIRFMSNENTIIAIPFFLFPEVSVEHLQALVSEFETKTIRDFTKSSNRRTEYENKLKVLSYYLSEQLFEYFIKYAGLDQAKKLDSNDLIQFNANTAGDDGLLAGISDSFSKDIFEGISPIDVDYSSFTFTQAVADFYKTVSNIDPDNQYYEDANGKKINENDGADGDRLSKIIVSINDLCDNITIGTIENQKYYASSLIDVFIDRGVIVPSLVHRDNKVVRAYKMGEYSKLTAEQMKVFTGMLKAYQDRVDRSLDKTESEKLCVLCFSIAIKENYFHGQVKFEEDCYGIAYSLYGPRVSQGETTYKVDSYSTLITKFRNDNTVKIQNNKYYLPFQKEPQDNTLNLFSHSLALGFFTIANVFKEYPHKTYPWNEYVHTLNDFLTLAAIGLSVKNQIFSLCAEVYQLTILCDSVFDRELTDYNKTILSGINSGLWKYSCYKGDALSKTINKIVKRNETTMHIISRFMEAYDKNPDLFKILELLGKLLYESAFFLNETLAFNVNFSTHLEDSESKSEQPLNAAKNTKKSLFGSSYWRHFKNERKEIEAKVLQYSNADEYLNWQKATLSEYKNQAKFYLDLCDLYIKTDIPEFVIIRDVLLLYSNTGELPDKIVGINEIVFDNITEDNYWKLYALPSQTDPKIIETVIRATFDKNSIRYIIIHGYNNFEGFIRIVEEVKGTAFKNNVCKIKSSFKKDVLPAVKELSLFTIEERKENSLMRGNYELIKTSSKKTELAYRTYIETKYSIFYKGNNDMAGDIFNISGDHIQVNTDPTAPVTQTNITSGCSLEDGNFCKKLSSEFALLRNELEKSPLFNNDDLQVALSEAEQATTQKDENKIKIALKKIASVGKDFLVSASASVIVQYMTYLGYLPS